MSLEKQSARYHDKGREYQRSPEWREKISLALKEKAKSPEHIENLKRAFANRLPPQIQSKDCAACGRKFQPGSNSARFCRSADCTSWGLDRKRHRATSPMCQICGTTERLKADHCHERNVFRGVLCNNCNSGLGFFADDPTRLLGAVQYLERTAHLHPVTATPATADATNQ